MNKTRIRLAADGGMGVCGALCRAQGSAPTAEDLELINSSFALEPLAAEQVYVRNIWAINTALFTYWRAEPPLRVTSSALRDLARTLTGRGLMLDHDLSVGSAIGMVFKTDIFAESLAAARERTGEDLRLPDGEDTVEWLIARVYLPLTDHAGMKEIAAKIDAGIIKFASMTFETAARTPVREEGSDKVLHYALPAPAEAQELSLVWLGAVPAAGVVRAEKHHEKKVTTSGTPKETSEKEILKMERLLTALGLQKDASEDAALEALTKQKTSAMKAQAIAAALGVETEEDAKQLKTAAEAGRKALEAKANAVIAAEGKLGRETSETRKQRLMAMSFDELDDELKFLDAQVAKAFPSEARTQASTSSEAPGGKSFTDRVEELKASGKTHLDAVKLASAEAPGAFASHVQTSSDAARLN